ncbi:MAG: curved DNA-binding protein [Candidatus Azotimanducaceae bacterium]|jgi:curved DNA-binding protein
MKYQDYYETLGVDKNADAKAIKNAYRKLARKYHPDVSKEPDAEESFKTVGEAYEVLKDPEKRSAYDQLGSNWQSGQDFQPPPGWSSFGAEDGYSESTFEFRDFSDLFGSIYGNGSQPHSRRPSGLDVHASVNLTLEDLYSGKSVDLYVVDPDTRLERTLRVKVPQHLRDGESFRLKGQGRSDPTGRKNGDLYVEIRFIPHPRFEVDGDHVHTTLQIAPWEAVLGAKVPVETLGGTVMLTIPNGSTSGTDVRLKNRGLPGAQSGHQYVKLVIQVPSKVSSREQELFEALAEASDFDPRK